MIKITVATALVFAAAVTVWAFLRPSRARSLVILGSWQAIEKDDRIWLMVETELITPRSRTASPPYVQEPHAQYLFLISPQGVEQRFKLQPDVIWTLRPAFSQIVGTADRFVLVHHTRSQDVELLIWDGQKFVRLEQEERGKLMDEMKLTEARLRAGSISELDEVCKRYGWKVLVRQRILLEEGFEGLGGRVRIARQKGDSQEKLVAMSGDRDHWTSLLIETDSEEEERAITDIDAEGVEE